MDESLVAFAKHEDAIGWVEDRKNPAMYGLVFLGRDNRWHVHRKLPHAAVDAEAELERIREAAYEKLSPSDIMALGL